MDRLPYIPSPPEHHWREFRVRFIPAIVFVIALLATIFLWMERTVPSNVVGQVETSHTKVVSPRGGSVAGLTVDRFQQVAAGEPIAKIIITNPKIIDSSLAVIRAEIEMMRVNHSPVQAQQRVLMDYERLKMDWMLQRIEVAAAKVRLQQVENEFQRVYKLYQEKLLPQGESTGYDVALRDRDTARIDVEGKEKIVRELGATVQGLAPGTGSMTNYTNDAMAAAIAVQEEKLRLTEAELSPITLYSPIDGLVSSIEHREGENVVAGEPIVTISALRGERIVGFIRAPVLTDAKPGMTVQVRARGNHASVGMSRVMRVGSQLETISPLLLPPNLRKDEVGLPILVSMPPELKLLPGELVDLILQ